MNFGEGTVRNSNTVLSFRQQQIVRLIQQAKSNKQIAAELNLTDGTVKDYVCRIFRKVGVANRTELAIWGCRTQEPLRIDPAL